MKKILIPVIATALLSGYALFHTPEPAPRNTALDKWVDDWNNNCGSHYSTTGREKSDCLKKVDDRKKKINPR